MFLGKKKSQTPCLALRVTAPASLPLSASVPQIHKKVVKAVFLKRDTHPPSPPPILRPGRAGVGATTVGPGGTGTHTPPPPGLSPQSRPATRARRPAAALPVRPVPPVLSLLHRPPPPSTTTTSSSSSSFFPPPPAGNAAPPAAGVGLSSGRKTRRPHRGTAPKFDSFSFAALPGAGASAGSRLSWQGTGTGRAVGSFPVPVPSNGEEMVMRFWWRFRFVCFAFLSHLEEKIKKKK